MGHNLEEDEMIDKLDHDAALKLLKLLKINYDDIVDALMDAHKAGLVPVAIAIPQPEITVNGIPIILEYDGKEVAVYHEDKSRLN